VPAAGAGWRPLILATMSFALSFAAWGLVGGLAPVFAGLYGLTASQTALLVAVPVLLGSLARLPMGMLTDRFGGRFVVTALLLVSAVAAWLVPATRSYRSLLVAAFLIGLAGSSFAVFTRHARPACRRWWPSCAGRRRHGCSPGFISSRSAASLRSRSTCRRSSKRSSG